MYEKLKLKHKKKVLRENKRHTTRRVGSARYAVTVGGTPPPCPGPRSGQGVSPPLANLDRYTPVKT